MKNPENIVPPQEKMQSTKINPSMFQKWELRKDLNNRPAFVITMFKDLKKNMFTMKNRNSKQRNRNYKERKCKP